MPTLQNTTKSKRSKFTSAKKFTQYLLGLGVLFIVSAVSFCPVTQAALTTMVLPLMSDFIVSFESHAHWVFSSLLVIGLGMRSKFQH